MTQEAVTPHQLIEKFLGYKRIAIAGVSRDPKDFTRSMYEEFRSRGYTVVPVNPAAEGIAGVPCYPHVSDIRPPVKAVLVMTPAKIAPRVVDDCAYAGVEIVWLHQGVGAGAVSEEAIELCRDRGMNVIAGYCPFMFFNHPGFIHSAHGVFKKLNRSYPN
jgi:predicted CoA-binding protein